MSWYSARVFSLTRRPESVFRLAAGGLAAISVLSSAIVILAHIRDRYGVDYGAGVWIALANYVNSGTVYPPLYDGVAFGGTRYMPVYFALHAGVTQLTGGDYVFAGKLLSLLTVILAIGLTFVIIRSFAVPRSFALLLATLVLLTDAGFGAATSIRADVLATLFQLAAVKLIVSGGPQFAVAAAALATLGVFTKISALWAPVAITLWLAFHHRRASVLFVVSFVGFVFGSALAVEVVSGGRFLDNLSIMAFSGIDREFAIQKATLYTLAILLTKTPAIWALVPFVLGSCVLAAQRRQLSIYHLAWLASLIILFVVMADRGTDVNQLIDPIFLGVIILGGLLAGERSAGFSPLGIVLSIAVLWAGGNAFALHLRARAQEVLVPLARGGSYAQPTFDRLLSEIRTGTRVLAEDASISVARGHRPVVLDAWTIPKIESYNREWVAQLASRIDAAQFDYVILLYRFEDLDPDFSGFYAAHFGKTVMLAIKGRYKWVSEIDGFQIYAPR